MQSTLNGKGTVDVSVKGSVQTEQRNETLGFLERENKKILKAADRIRNKQGKSSVNAGLEEFFQGEWLGRRGISEGIIFRK